MDFDTFAREHGTRYNKTQLEQFKEILELYNFKIQYYFPLIEFKHEHSSFVCITYDDRIDKYEISHEFHFNKTVIKNYNTLIQNLNYNYLRYLKHNNNLHLLTLDKCYYTHKHNLDKSIKISTIDYEYIIALCEIYGFYGCYWTNETIRFTRQYDNYVMYDDEFDEIIGNVIYVIKITKKYTILLYDNYNIKKSCLFEIIEYMNKNLNYLKNEPLQKIAQNEY